MAGVAERSGGGEGTGCHRVSGPWHSPGGCGPPDALVETGPKK